MILSKIAIESGGAVAGPSRPTSSYILPSLTINRAYRTPDYSSWKGYKVLAKGITLISTQMISIQLHAEQSEIIFNQIQPYILSITQVGMDSLVGLYHHEPLLAQKSSDGNWYRAVLLKKNNGQVTVKLIDTGETVNCTKHQVMICPMQFKHYVPGVVSGKITGFNRRKSAAEVRAELVCGKDLTIVIDAADSSGLMFSIYDLNMAPLSLLLEQKLLLSYPLCEPSPIPVKKCSRCGYEEPLVEATCPLSTCSNAPALEPTPSTLCQTNSVRGTDNFPVSAVRILDRISWQLSGPNKNELQDLLTVFLIDISNDEEKLKLLLNAWTYSKKMPTSPLIVTDALEDELGFTACRSALYLPQHITGQQFFDVLNEEILAANK